MEKVFPNDFIAEPVVHIPSEELQSGTLIRAESLGTSMIYAYDDIIDKNVILVKNLIKQQRYYTYFIDYSSLLYCHYIVVQ